VREGRRAARQQWRLLRGSIGAGQPRQADGKIWQDLAAITSAAEAAAAKAALENPQCPPAEAVAILVRHAADPALAWRACYRIGRLVYESAATKDALGAAGAAEAVTAAMRGHPGDADVQGHGCHALACLAYKHAANKAMARGAGCAEAIGEAMRYHPGQEEVHGYGRWALRIVEIVERTHVYPHAAGEDDY
jgi:hypothetical protein